jgi:hypothetical protein
MNANNKNVHNKIVTSPNTEPNDETYCSENSLREKSPPNEALKPHIGMPSEPILPRFHALYDNAPVSNFYNACKGCDEKRKEQVNAFASAFMVE